MTQERLGRPQINSIPDFFFLPHPNVLTSTPSSVFCMGWTTHCPTSLMFLWLNVRKNMQPGSTITGKHSPKEWRLWLSFSGDQAGPRQENYQIGRQWKQFIMTHISVSVSAVTFVAIVIIEAFKEEVRSSRMKRAQSRDGRFQGWAVGLNSPRTFIQETLMWKVNLITVI